MAYTETVVNGRKIILDENGKPCRSCNSMLDFQMMTGKASGATVGSIAAVAAPKPEVSRYRQDPPDSAQLGSSTWTFLHSMAAKFPKKATPSQQTEMNVFLHSFSKYYPCEPCAEDFREWIKEHKPATHGREELSLWMCDAHNAVNKKLGKPSFDCRNWQARWKDGWDALNE